MSEWSDHTFVASDGTKLHYVEMGEGDRPIVLLHGAGGSAVGNWFANGIAPALASTHRVIGIDARGHGLSESGPGGTGKMAKDVVEFLDGNGIERAHIGGYSMGGMITLALLTSIRERFLSAHFGGAGIPETSEWADKVPPDPPGTDPEAKAAQAAYNGVQRERGAEVGNGAESGGRRGGIAALLANLTDEERAAMAARRREQADRLDLSSVDFPVLAVNGEFDGWRAKTHRMWRELPDFTNVVLSGKGHLSAVMVGFIPPAYIDAMVAFYNRPVFART